MKKKNEKIMKAIAIFIVLLFVGTAVLVAVTSSI